MKSETWFRNRAYEIYHREGEIEIDETAPVSIGETAGAYVQAWIWVRADEVTALPRRLKIRRRNTTTTRL
jgi:hypothetical protein